MMKYLGIILLVVFYGCTDQKIQSKKNGLQLSKAMHDIEESGFNKADKPIEFIFTKDHGPHDKFKTEWWYFTGNLVSEEGNEFGYQFTIFRNGISSDSSKINSKWGSNNFYMGHFAISDISNNRFYFEEKFSRDGNGLAGASVSDGFKVWLEDWKILQIGDKMIYDLPELNINAEMDKVKIDLRLKAKKRKTLQGNNGLSQKSDAVGNASYYYSYTLLESSGELIVNDESYKVYGSSWMDREWSTSSLGKDQIGWDWFALQLNDNTELMYYQMRKKDGTTDVFSNAVIVDKEGKKYSFSKNQVDLIVKDYWESPSGITYPAAWQLNILDANIHLNVKPKMQDQFMDVSIKYWEGAVQISGSKKGKEINGSGYVELTGY